MRTIKTRMARGPEIGCLVAMAALCARLPVVTGIVREINGVAVYRSRGDFFVHSCTALRSYCPICSPLQSSGVGLIRCFLRTTKRCVAKVSKQDQERSEWSFCKYGRTRSIVQMVAIQVLILRFQNRRIAKISTGKMENKKKSRYNSNSSCDLPEYSWQYHDKTASV